MAKISVSSIALVLVWMVCIATQDTQQQAEFERRVESLEKQLIELASFSKIPECELKAVVKNKVIPWHSDKQTITFTTDSVARSNAKAVVTFYGDGNRMGGVYILFNKHQVEYRIISCNHYAPLLLTPTDYHKTWKIKYNHEEQRVVLYLDEVEVANVSLSDSVCPIERGGRMTWRSNYDKKPTKISFKWDTASDNYCISSYPECEFTDVVKSVKKPWNPDTQSIHFTTDSVAESEEKVALSFYNSNGRTGTVYITFYKEIKYYLFWCNSGYESFTAQVPAQQLKNWKIVFDFHHHRLVILCNGVHVLDVELSQACRINRFGSRKPTQLEFSSYDNASDKYCFSNDAKQVLFNARL